MTTGIRMNWVMVALMGVTGGLAAGELSKGFTLQECIQTGLKANPDLKSAAARVEAARAAVREASSAFYPQLGLSGSWTRTDNPPQAFFMSLNQRRATMQKDFNNPEDIENARGSVVAQWRLCDGGRRLADHRAAKIGVEAATYTVDAARNDLVYQITKAYYSVLQARGFVTVREETVKSLSGSLKIATERFKSGSSLKTDVLNLEVQFSQAEEDLIRAKNGLQLGVAALNTAIGKDLLGMDSVFALPEVAGAAPAVQENADIESRPEWRVMQAQMSQAEALMKRARREYMPVINAFGSVDLDSEPFHGAEQSYLVGAVVDINIFDGYRTRSGVARAAAGVVGVQAEADKLHNLLTLDLTQSKLNEQEARERLVVAGKSLSSAEEGLRITRERYKEGAADITELLAAQVGLTVNRTRQVAAQYDTLIARANVERAVGKVAGAGEKLKLEEKGE